MVGKAKARLVRWSAGLRTRVVLAFVAVAMASAAAASGAGYLVARGSLIDTTQEHRVESVRAKVSAQAPEMQYPPMRQDLERLRTVLGADAMVTYENRTAASGDALELVSEELRDTVADSGGFGVQRVVTDAGPRLVVATPIVLTGVDGRRRDSGVDVYVVEDLGPTEDQLDHWARIVVLTIVAALPLAVVLALLVSRGVLRPVRRLGTTANELAAGNLATRLEPSGHDELAGLAATFNETAAALERTVGELRHQEAEARRFVGDVSHELRTPIMALTSLMEMLEDDARDRSTEERELAAMAVDRTRKLARLAEDLLELSRFDAGAAVLRLERIDVTHVVTDMLRTRGWSDDVQVIADGEVQAEIDVRRFEIAVANLVGNAMRHGRPPVRINVGARGGDVEVTVTDDGPGLPDDVTHARLFARFYKADTARTRSDGSGLGLSIALANARLHGGDVTASNGAARGARFVLRVPGEPSRARPGETAGGDDEDA